MSLRERLKAIPSVHRAGIAVKLKARKAFWAPWILFNLLRGQNVVIYDGYGPYRGWRLLPSNWGDDLNCFFFGAVTPLKMVPIPPSAYSFPVRHHLLIGSILNWSNLDRAVVFGSGIIDPDGPVRGHPLRIHSVRGPLTRDVLLRHGIDCPECYGDPALLLPLFHRPERKPDGPVVLVPHADTVATPAFRSLARNLDADVVDMARFGCWTDVIDRIAGASLVLSESLHGLIVAETYRVPSVWVEFVPHVPEALRTPSTRDWTFKFRDFYASVGKTVSAPLRLFEASAPPDPAILARNWTPAEIDFREQLSHFPFPLSVKAHVPD